MKIFISIFNSHLNHFLYSLIEYKKKYKTHVTIIYEPNIKSNCVLILVFNKTYFLDYSDCTDFADLPSKFDFYFKRSLKPTDFLGNVKPLNFQINISTSPLMLLHHLPKQIDFLVKSKVEIVRMLDLLKFTNMNHYSMMHYKFLSGQKVEGNGKVIFCSRLWNPENHKDPEEKSRRQLQNDFRVNACRIIKKNFKNATVGIFDSKLAREICPDIIFPNKIISKQQYFKELVTSSIGIAGYGLKDTPGWKIGEYAFMGKSIITTPIQTVVEDFKDNINYLKLSNRISYDEIPDKIEALLSSNTHKKMSDANVHWSRTYLDPVNYVTRIIDQ